MRVPVRLGQIPVYIGEDTVQAVGPRLPRIGNRGDWSDIRDLAVVDPAIMSRGWPNLGQEPGMEGAPAFVAPTPVTVPSGQIFAPEITVPSVNQPPAATSGTRTAWWNVLPAAVGSAAILAQAIGTAVRGPSVPAAPRAAAVPQYVMTAAGTLVPNPAAAAAVAAPSSWFSSPILWIGLGAGVMVAVMMIPRR